jgi:hypothetical protein
LQRWVFIYSYPLRWGRSSKPLLFQSLISLCLGWLIPATKAKMPLTDTRRHINGHRILSVSAQRSPNKKAHAPELRRHSSFHPAPVPIIGSFFHRPTHGRQVSFTLASPKRSSAPNTLHKSYSPMRPFALKDFTESDDSSLQSSLRSDDSRTLVSTSSSSRANDLLAQGDDAKYDCHSSRPMTPLELDIQPPFSYPSSPLALPKQLLGKRLPSMKKAFRRRTSSSSSAIIIAEVEPGIRSELLRSSLDSTGVMIAQSDSVSGNISGDNYRPAFVRPFIPSRSKTMPHSPRGCLPLNVCMCLANNMAIIVVDQEAYPSRKSNIGFSNPWSTPRGPTGVSDTPFVAAGMGLTLHLRVKLLTSILTLPI